MRALVAMSGGVDSSVAAALLLDQGHEVVGATMKLWGGPSDTGCCSVADVEDARRVAQQLGIEHHVFNFTGDFERDVVAPYVGDHAGGRTPNPCIACNRHLKFDRFLGRARMLGFDAMATGHHARVTREPGPAGGTVAKLRRGRDRAKDQSYVLYMLGQEQLASILLPVGEMTKAEVRARAAAYGLRTAGKPDSQDVCFIPRHGGRQSFLGQRLDFSPGRLVTTGGDEVGRVDALELVTVGQRRGLGLSAPSLPDRRFVLDVDLAAGQATLGNLDQLLVNEVRVVSPTWASGFSPGDAGGLLAQFSAHGRPVSARWVPGADQVSGTVVLLEAVRRVAPGQAVVLYAPGPAGDDWVLGGGTAA